MPKKKTPSIAARFGARSSSTLRKRWTKVMLRKTATYSCPSCLRKSVERVSVGVWRCSKCGYTFAGGAYEPTVRRR